jgi:hypothetical protein
MLVEIANRVGEQRLALKAPAWMFMSAAHVHAISMGSIALALVVIPTIS